MPHHHTPLRHPHRRIPTHENILPHAKHLHERSRRIPGRDVENWLDAETWLLSPESPPLHFRPHVKPASPLPDPCAIPSEAHILAS